MDRVLGVLSIVLLAIAVLPFVPQRVDRSHGVVADPWRWRLAGVRGRGGRGVQPSSSIVAHRRSRARAAVAARLQRLALSLTDAVRRYAHHHVELVTVLLASVGVQCLRVVQAYCLGRALVDRRAARHVLRAHPGRDARHAAAHHGQRARHEPARVRRALRPGRRSAPPAVALSILFIALGIVGNLPGQPALRVRRPRRESDHA